jgi:hypothetical protein
MGCTGKLVPGYDVYNPQRRWGRNMQNKWFKNIKQVHSFELFAPLSQCFKKTLWSPGFNVNSDTLKLGLSMSTDIAFEACWGLNLTIGFSRKGFFLDMTEPNELTYAL